MKMSSPCIILQGSASNSWKWVIAGQLGLLEIEINSYTDNFSKKGMPQHSEASCTLGYVSCLSITPSSALRKIVLNGKGDGGTGAWSL